MTEIAPIDELTPGIYRLRSRNLVVGAWWPERRGFVGIRRKFNARYLFTEFHRDHDPHVGTVTGAERIGDLPPGVTVSDAANPTLFAVLDLAEAPVREEIAREHAAWATEAESQRWRPQTASEAERERRLAELHADRPTDHREYVEAIQRVIRETSEPERW